MLLTFIRYSTYFTRYLKQQIMQQLLPASCILCGCSTQKARHICVDCMQNLPILPHSCQQCALFLPAGIVGSVCGTCLQQPPPFTHIYALFPYQAPIIQLIIQLKFQHALSHAEAFGNLLAEKIQTTWYAQQTLPDLILPVPLHTKRLCERGFNQALEIARPLAKTLHIPIDAHGVQRCKPTAAQSGLSAEERKRNIVNAFNVLRDYSDLSIAVIDDVVTTGQTVIALSKALKAHGAKNVVIWCCARRG